jgi:hypothetical protein
MRGRRTSLQQQKEVSIFNDTQEGIAAWCRYTDALFWKEQQAGETRRNGRQQRGDPYYIRRLVARFAPFRDKALCNAEFFRYIQWHNLALETIRHKNMSSHLLFYEDYELNFTQTVHALLAFLQLPTKHEPMKLILGKRYRNKLFSPEERTKIFRMLREFSTDELWSLIGPRYFPGSESDKGLQELHNTSNVTTADAR